MKGYMYKMIPRFSDFDGYGIVHHSQFLKFVEEARIQMLRDVFSPELDEVLGPEVQSLVMDVYVKYIRTIDKTKQIYVNLVLKLVGNAYLQFDFKILSGKNDIYANGYTRHCFTRIDHGMLLSYPEPFNSRVKKIIENKEFDYLIEEGL